MNVKSIKTHRIEVLESIEDILARYIDYITEKDILVITSKIISVCQGRVINRDSIDKTELIKQEADALIDVEHSSYGISLTLKNGLLIPSAGIDESNANNQYILYPENVQNVANSIWKFLKDKYSINNLGVVITDSHTTPTRSGVTGIALAWCGFKPLYSYIGSPDIYGHNLRVTKINILDALAVAAVFVMGEGAEHTPMALIQDAPKIVFLDREPSQEEVESVKISIEDDLYSPLLQAVKWKKKTN